MKKSSLKRTKRLNPIWRRSKTNKAALDAIRPELAKRCRGRCENCGELPNHVYYPGRPYLEAHHLNHNRNDNTTQNIMMLCPNCHTLYHDGKLNLGERNEIED